MNKIILLILTSFVILLALLNPKVDEFDKMIDHAKLEDNNNLFIARAYRESKNIIVNQDSYYLREFELKRSNYFLF